MSDFSFDPSNPSAFERLIAASIRSGRSEASDVPEQGRLFDPQFGRGGSVLARLEKAVDATNESAHVLDRARNAAEQVRFENQASAEARVSDVERVAQLAKAVADRIAEEKRASLAQASGFSASTIQRLLG